MLVKAGIGEGRGGGGSMEGSSADRLFVGFWFFFSGEGEEFARAQMARIWSSGRERSRRAWSTSVGELPVTSFPIGGFQAGLRRGGLGRLDFLLFLSGPLDAFAARYIFQTGVFVFTLEVIASGAVRVWVAGRRLRGMGDGGHCRWGSSGRVT